MPGRQTPDRSGLPSGVRARAPRVQLPSASRGPLVRMPLHCAEAGQAAINTAARLAAILLQWVRIVIILLLRFRYVSLPQTVGQQRPASCSQPFLPRAVEPRQALPKRRGLDLIERQPVHREPAAGGLVFSFLQAALCEDRLRTFRSIAGFDVAGQGVTWADGQPG